jgi:hypothetical protein
MLPNLIIIGAMKSGTTSLHYYLNLHPEISMSNPKEVDFFSNPSNWRKGIQWYETHFQEASKIRGESSTNYSKFPTFSNVSERMYETIPGVKLIYLLRDPVERIISHYTDRYANGMEKRSFKKALQNLNNNHYLNCSKYFLQLEQYLNFFPKSNIAIVQSADLRDQRRNTLKSLFRFLGVDAGFDCSQFLKILHKSSDKSRNNIFGQILNQLLSLLPGSLKDSINALLPSQLKTYSGRLAQSKVHHPILYAALKQEIIKHLRDDVERLREYTGMSFSNWSL